MKKIALSSNCLEFVLYLKILFVLCVNFLIWDMEWVWPFPFGLCLTYALASTNNNKQNNSLVQNFS